MQTIIRVEKLAKTFNQHQALHAVDRTFIMVKWWLCLGRRVPENPPFTSLKRFDYRR